MQKAKGAAVDAIQFNTLAVILALVVLPLSVAAITQGNGTVSDYVWTDNWEEDPTAAKVLWREQGGNLSSIFNADVAGSGQCSYLVPLPGSDRLTMCYGEGGPVKVITSSDIEQAYLLSRGVYPSISPTAGLTFHDGLAAEIDYAHAEPVMNDGSSYIGSTTDGPFSWWFDDVDIQFEDSIPIAFRITMIRGDTYFDCSNPIFQNVSFDMSLTILRPKVAYPYDSYSINETFEGGNQWVCFVGFDMLIPISNYEALSLRKWIEEGNYSDGTGPGQTTWDDVEFNFKIDNIRDAANNPGWNVAKPWEGDPSTSIPMNIVFQSSTVQEASINLYIKGGTLVLSVLICGVGVASTSYWNPLQNWFKGALK
jgi:hypothetical protein